MIRRNFDILAALVLVLFLTGAGEFRERVQRARVQRRPSFDLVVHSDLDRTDLFARLERRFAERMERLDRRINDRVLRISERIENLPHCPFEK